MAYLCCAAPATFAETVTLKMMIAVSTDAEELARLDLTHRRIVNLHGIRHRYLLGQRHLSTVVEKAIGDNSML